MPTSIRGLPPPAPASVPTATTTVRDASPAPAAPARVEDAFSTGVPARGDSGGEPSAFLALVKSLQPVVHTPTAYEAHFGVQGKTSRAHVEGQGQLDVPAFGDRGPSFTAEAGKPLIVSIDPERVLKSAEKIELVWRLVPDGTEKVVALTDGTRDPATGRLVTTPAQLDLPPDADGLVRLSFRTHSGGRESNSWDPSNDVAIAPREGSTLVFSDDWKTQLDKPIRAGDSLKIAYDQDRLRGLFGGNVPSSITACISFNGEPAKELPLTLTPGEGGRPGTMALPSFKVPVDATQMTLWFKGQNGGDTSWDSADGRNFEFSVGPTRDDLEPGWKAEILRSSSFPNLEEKDFTAIGPHSERYNCIAWTVGVRNEWVWPGTRVEDFDALYGKSGYQALDTLDLSHDPKLEKVVIYGLPPRSEGGPIEVTHGALQDEAGRWTSKIGTQPLIRHQSVEDLAGGSYGEPVRVYVRPRAEVHS